MAARNRKPQTNRRALLAGKTVLVIDDDLATRTLLGFVLKQLGLRVRFAEDGTAAQAHLDPAPDLIILDLMMPRTSGYDVIDQLQQTAPNLLARTIIYTAAPSAGDPLLGTLPVLHKPFELQAFITALEAALKATAPSVPGAQERAAIATRLKQLRPRKGFARGNDRQRTAMARKGGDAAQASGNAHRFTTTTAALAGKKGGSTTAQNREHMAAISRKKKAH